MSTSPTSSAAGAAYASTSTPTRGHHQGLNSELESDTRYRKMVLDTCAWDNVQLFLLSVVFLQDMAGGS